MPSSVPFSTPSGSTSASTSRMTMVSISTLFSIAGAALTIPLAVATGTL